MAIAVTTVASGGLPVTDVTATHAKLGLHVAEVAKGLAVTKGPGGLPVNFAPVADWPDGGGAPAGDPYWSSVKLLMGFNGADASTGSPGMTDESSALHGTGTVTAATVISTSQFRFGTSSLRVPLSGRVLFSDHADWQLSTANSDQFTVECWVRFNTIGTNRVFVAQYSNTGNYGWALQTNLTTGEFKFFFSPDGTTVVDVNTTGAALVTGVWYHVAADKSADGKIRVYKDGVMIGSATPANSVIFNTGQPLTIGATAAAVGLLDGWIDELRITKGVARYASDSGYTVPTSAFPRS